MQHLPATGQAGHDPGLARVESAVAAAGWAGTVLPRTRVTGHMEETLLAHALAHGSLLPTELTAAITNQKKR